MVPSVPPLDAFPAVPSRVQDTAAAMLRSRILGGEYPVGSRLPPERRLAEELGLSRLSLRSALTTLEAEGLVRARQGSGVEVLDFRQTAGLDLFTFLLSQEHVSADQTAEYFKDVLRLRRCLAIDTMLQAAKRVTADDLAELESLVAEQKQRLEDPMAYLEGDLRYQRVIVRIAGSTAMELMFNSLERVIWAHADLVLAFIGPLRRHWSTYGMVHGLLRTRKPWRWRRMAEAALDLVEAQGLRRVRQRCRERAAPSLKNQHYPENRP